MLLDDIIVWFLGLLTALITVATAVVLYFAITQHFEWKRFAAEHKCVVVHVGPSKLMPVTQIVNKVPVVTQMVVSGDKTWRCNDGKEYIR